MTIDEARGLAAQAWCHGRNRHTVMDPDLCESFAEILVKAVNDALQGKGKYSSVKQVDFYGQVIG